MEAHLAVVVSGGLIAEAPTLTQGAIVLGPAIASPGKLGLNADLSRKGSHD
jgi:hypothetical protein